MKDETEIETLRGLRATLPEATQKWLSEKQMLLAMKHDIGGPDLRRVSEPEYRQQLARQMYRCAMAAHLAGEIVLPRQGMDALWGLLGWEIIQMRQRKKQYQAGEITKAELRRWEAFETHRAYFDDDHSLMTAAILDDTLDSYQEKQPVAKTSGIATSVHAEAVAEVVAPAQTAELRAADEEWSKRLVYSAAMLGDYYDIPCQGISERAYGEQIASHLESVIHAAIQHQNISAPSSGVKQHAQQLAAEVWQIRRLHEAWAAGKLSDQALKCLPLYHKYHVYFVPAHEKLPLLLSYLQVEKRAQDMDAGNAN